MRIDKQKVRKTILLVIIAFFFIKGVLSYFPKRAGPELPPPPVVVQKPKSLKIADYVTQTGTLVAYNSVNLVARIEGYLKRVQYTDGTFVQKGQPLFVVEPKPYLEKLKAAEAAVAMQKASYAYTKAEYARQKRMYQQNATSLNNVEKWAAQTEVVQAGIDQAIANAAIASINYSYTHVLAPFSGRMGRHLVDPGNLVGNGKATDLATLQQIDPIYVYFNLNELDLIKIRDAARLHGFKSSELHQINVLVRLQNETHFAHKGHLDFINTGLNASTGTMEFRALLSNKDYALLPGLFVQVRIPIEKPKPQLTLPDTAIQYDQMGAYVLALDSESKVIVKRIVLGPLDEGIRAVTEGISAQDTIIVSGLQNATPGRPVSPQLSEKIQR